MSKLGWIGVAILVANGLLAAWVGWQRYRKASELDTIVVGTITTARAGSGRSSTDFLVATYEIGGKTYTVPGSSSESSKLSVKNHPLNSRIDVYVSSKSPEIAALTRTAGYEKLFVIAGLLIALALGICGYGLLKKT